MSGYKTVWRWPKRVRNAHTAGVTHATHIKNDEVHDNLEGAGVVRGDGGVEITAPVPRLALRNHTKDGDTVYVNGQYQKSWRWSKARSTAHTSENTAVPVEHVKTGVTSERLVTSLDDVDTSVASEGVDGIGPCVEPSGFVAETVPMYEGTASLSYIALNDGDMHVDTVTSASETTSHSVDDPEQVAEEYRLQTTAGSDILPTQGEPAHESGVTVVVTHTHTVGAKPQTATESNAVSSRRQIAHESESEIESLESVTQGTIWANPQATAGCAIVTSHQ
ncbi:hypothetical protein SARC_15373, partial [Sphaeroforma arctica JP610]